MSTTARCEIAVVGGGVIGAAMALVLSRAGFDVRLLDRGTRPEPFNERQYDPRVYAISPGSAAFLDQLGVWKTIAAARVSPYERMRVWERVPERALQFSAADVAMPQLGWIVEQQLLLDALWQALPAAVPQAGTAVTDARLEEGGSLLRMAGGRDLQARLVISAEGREARLRELAGIEAQGWSYAQTALVSHVRTSRPHGRCALQRFLKGGPLAFLPLADGRRSIVWSLPPAEAERLLAADPDSFHKELAAAAQFEVGAIDESSPRFVFPLRLMHAQRYAAPGFALVGDSAHSIHPLAGQGANLGFADAQTLAQQLTEARDAGRDWSSLRVLQRYQRHRRGANLEMLALTDSLQRAFDGSVPGLPALLGAGLQLVQGFGPARELLVRRAIG